MKKLLLVVLAAVALWTPLDALAHPLGNFTVNRYSRVEISGDRVYVLYVLDMAEIPAYQERQRMGSESAYLSRKADELGEGLELRVGGERVTLRPVRRALAFPEGVGGLRTMRLQAVYASGSLARGGETARLIYRDTNFGDRIGWKEVVVRPRDGARLLSSTVPSESVSRETLAYPKDLLRSPLDVTGAEASFVAGGEAGPPPEPLTPEQLGAQVTVRSADGGFAALIAGEDLSAGVILVSLFLALFWGAAHALSPGHGKAIVAAYLVGTRGTPRHAVYLGLIVTVTHTIGVFALGLVTLALSEFIVPDQLYPWLNLVSALLVVGVGLTVLRWRVREWRRRGHSHHHHHHHQQHGHGGDGHSHSHELEPGMRGLVGMGISGGIIPCPTALVVLLAAISLHRVGYGLILIVAFSVGLAAAMSAIGLLAVTARRAFSRVDFEGSALRLLPALSALAIVAFGVVMTARALPTLT
jgi:nickel/cobalt exporter